MKKFSLLAVVLIIFLAAGLIKAQDNNMMLSAFVGYNMPMGTAADTYKSSVGFELQFEYLLLEDMGIDITAGYIPWNYENEVKGQTFAIIPVLIGGRYYFTAKGMSSYAGFDLGLYNTQFKNEIDNRSESKFGFSLIGGVLFPMSDNLYVNGNLNYTSISTAAYNFSYIAIHAGVSLTF
ncbi:MAG: outer membrane beta-barrel protein [Ignavibacteriae bacterium]|nr:outer membrane beta-barrel protein [Ignavibacteriota bacterium]